MPSSATPINTSEPACSALRSALSADGWKSQFQIDMTRSKTAESRSRLQAVRK